MELVVADKDLSVHEQVKLDNLVCIALVVISSVIKLVIVWKSRSCLDLFGVANWN